MTALKDALDALRPLRDAYVFYCDTDSSITELVVDAGRASKRVTLEHCRRAAAVVETIEKMMGDA